MTVPYRFVLPPIILAASLVGAVLYFTTLAPLFSNSLASSQPHNPSPAPIEKIAAAHDSVEPTKQALPLRLRIPKLGIDANIVEVGTTTSGSMEMTASLADVGWLRLGQRPGQIGSAVIAGHFGWRNGAAAVFNRLSALRAGDKLLVEDADGITTTFIVQRSKSYAPNSSAPEVFSSDDGKSHLNLITCEGVWSDSLAEYSQRLVVFTDMQ